MKSKNRALLSCSPTSWLHFKINPSFLAFKMAEKSGTHGNVKVKNPRGKKRDSRTPGVRWEYDGSTMRVHGSTWEYDGSAMGVHCRGGTLTLKLKVVNFKT